jgi:hypothetical protein
VLAQEKSMKNYQRGDPTAALYLKNLPKAIDESTLRALCRPYLPAPVSTEYVAWWHVYYPWSYETGKCVSVAP